MAHGGAHLLGFAVLMVIGLPGSLLRGPGRLLSSRMQLLQDPSQQQNAKLCVSTIAVVKVIVLARPLPVEAISVQEFGSASDFVWVQIVFRYR